MRSELPSIVGSLEKKKKKAVDWIIYKIKYPSVPMAEA